MGLPMPAGEFFATSLKLWLAPAGFGAVLEYARDAVPWESAQEYVEDVRFSSCVWVAVAFFMTLVVYSLPALSSHDLVWVWSWKEK